MKGLFYTVLLGAACFAIAQIWRQSRMPTASSGPSLEALVAELVAARGSAPDSLIDIVLSQRRGAREPLALPGPRSLLARAQAWLGFGSAEPVAIPKYAWVMSQRPATLQACYDPVSAARTDRIMADVLKAMDGLGKAGMRANMVVEGELAAPVLAALASLADRMPPGQAPPVERFVGVGVSKDYLARLDPARFAHFVPPASLRSWVVLWTPADGGKVHLEVYAARAARPAVSGESAAVRDGPELAALLQAVLAARTPEEFPGVRPGPQAPAPSRLAPERAERPREPAPPSDYAPLDGGHGDGGRTPLGDTGWGLRPLPGLTGLLWMQRPVPGRRHGEITWQEFEGEGRIAAIRVFFGTRDSFSQLRWDGCELRGLAPVRNQHHGRPAEICSGADDGALRDGTRLRKDIFAVRDGENHLLVTYRYAEGTRERRLDDFFRVCDAIVPDR